ncbi:MAG: hypothetical protein WAV05_09730 [Anaerolineales bacterium]
MDRCNPFPGLISEKAVIRGGIGFLLAVIFISVEFFATLFGFALFGGYLGLRPSISREKQSN